MVSSSDKAYITAIQKGDSRVYEKFFCEFYSALCTYSKMVVSRSDVAEDIVQELFCKIWNKKESFNVSTSLKAYLYRSVYNNSIEFLRTEKLENNYKEFNVYDMSIDSNSETKEDLLSALNNAINELPEKRREVFKLRKLEKLSHAEIAERLDISPKTVETHIHRASLELKDKLKNIKLLILFFILLHNL